MVSPNLLPSVCLYLLLSLLRYSTNISVIHKLFIKKTD